MSSHDLQILVIVDVYPVVSAEELKRELPDARDERVIFRLTDPEFGAPRLEPPPNTLLVDWPTMGRAVEALAGRVREIRAEKPNDTVLFVGGRGPLSVFVHLGYLFSNFGGRQVVLNQPPGGGPWEHFEMAALAAPDASPPFQVNGLAPSVVKIKGQVGLSVDTAGRDTPEEVFQDFINEQGEGVAGVIKVSSKGPIRITPETSSAVVQQLTEILSRAPSLYPRRSGFALFVGGPAQLAFALGRAMNPNVVGDNIWLTEHRSGKYELLYSLPFHADEAPAIPDTSEDTEARRKILDTMLAGIDDLKKKLKPEHLPTDVLPQADRERFIHRLSELNHVARVADAFKLSVLQGEYTLGEGLLEAFRQSSEQQRQDFAKLLLLHEVLHNWQGVCSSSYFDVGRAGVVLEQIDFAADSFALRAIMNMELDLVRDQAHERVREILKRWIEAVLHGVEAFDIMEQRSIIKRLSERRLRRYLTWHLQLARASTVKDASQVDRLLRPGLTVELAPLVGRIDVKRYEKVVLHALPNTELFCAIGGHLVREPKRPGFDPVGLVDAVRNHATTVIQAAMIALIDWHPDKLVPWAGDEPRGSQA